jgi:hypothetical protein
MPFGGVPIVFTGDFHQLRPVACEEEGTLYEGAMNGLFEGIASMLQSFWKSVIDLTKIPNLER